MTGCGKFIIFLLIAAPLAYLGASYYNGQDGFQNIKSLLGMGERASDEGTTLSLSDSEWQKRLDDKESEIEKLQQENKDLRERIEDLESRVKTLENNDSEGTE